MSVIQSSSEIDFETDQFLQKEDTEAFRLPPWTDPDVKIESYRRRRQNHEIKRDDYKRRFIEFKIFMRKMQVGQNRKAPSQSFPEFLAKVSSRYKSEN